MKNSTFFRRRLPGLVLGAVLGALAGPVALAQDDRPRDRQQWEERRAERQQARQDRQNRQNLDYGYDPRALPPPRDDTDMRGPPKDYSPRSAAPGPYDGRARPGGNRLTPEERQELRDQIYKAGRNYRRDGQ